MSELKPCPFCGKEVFLLDVAIQPAPDAKWDVYCRTHECFLNSGTNNMFINREDAIIAWNTRASESAIRAQGIKEVREEINKLWQINPSYTVSQIGEGGEPGMLFTTDVTEMIDRMKSKGGKV